MKIRKRGMYYDWLGTRFRLQVLVVLACTLKLFAWRDPLQTLISVLIMYWMILICHSNVYVLNHGVHNDNWSTCKYVLSSHHVDLLITYCVSGINGPEIQQFALWNVPIYPLNKSWKQIPYCFFCEQTQVQHVDIISLFVSHIIFSVVNIKSRNLTQPIANLQTFGDYLHIW